MKTKLTKLIPWAVALAIFYYLFSKYPLGQLAQAAKHLNLWLFIPYAVLYFLFMWIVDCWTLSWLFGRFGFPTRIREIMTVRLASYLIMVINYGASQGVLAYFFKKVKSVPFFKSSSLILFTVIIDLYWTISFAFMGSFYSDLVIEGVNLSRVIQTLWGGATVGLLALFIFWRLPLNVKAIHWIRSRDLFYTFHHAKAQDYLTLMLMRLPMHLAINSSLYFVALTFGVHIPLMTTWAYLPIVILIGTIPITPRSSCSPLTTLATPSRTTQCSARCSCICKLSFWPGSTTTRLILYPNPSSKTV